MVLNYNGSRIGSIFDECIASLLATDYRPIEIVIADNGSKDDSTREAVERHDNTLLRAVMLNTNRGTAGGNNAAFQHGSLKGELIAFVNNDIVVPPDWLRHLVDAMERDPKLAACGPIVAQDGLVMAGSFLTMGGTTLQLNSVPLAETYYVNYVSGCCIMVRSSIFKSLGGFNPGFFMYYDETDLCARMRRAGFEVGCVPFTRVVHYGSRTVKATTPGPGSFYMTRNRFLYLYMNRRARDLAVALPVAVMAILKDTLFLLHRRDKATLRFMTSNIGSGLTSTTRSLSVHNRRPFRDRLTLPVLADFLSLLPQDAADAYLQRMMAKLVVDYLGGRRSHDSVPQNPSGSPQRV